VYTIIHSPLVKPHTLAFNVIQRKEILVELDTDVRNSYISP